MHGPRRARHLGATGNRHRQLSAHRRHNGPTEARRPYTCQRSRERVDDRLQRPPQGGQHRVRRVAAVPHQRAARHRARAAAQRSARRLGRAARLPRRTTLQRALEARRPLPHHHDVGRTDRLPPARAGPRRRRHRKPETSRSSAPRHSRPPCATRLPRAPGVELCEGYGLTEGTCASSRSWPSAPRPGSVGQRSPNSGARCVKTPFWRIRGLLDRGPRALPSCWRRLLPPTAFAWLPMSPIGAVWRPLPRLLLGDGWSHPSSGRRAAADRPQGRWALAGSQLAPAPPSAEEQGCRYGRSRRRAPAAGPVAELANYGPLSSAPTNPAFVFARVFVC